MDCFLKFDELPPRSFHCENEARFFNDINVKGFFSFYKMVCQKKIQERIEFLLNLILHIIILFTVLTIFFFVYVRTLLKASYENEIDDILGNQFQKKLYELDDDVQKNIRDLLKDVNFNSYLDKFDETNSYVLINNKWLAVVCILIFVFFVCLFLTIYFFVNKTCGVCLDIRSVIYENLCLFSIVGLIEISFFIFIAVEYVQVSPTVMLDSFLSDISAKLA